MAMYEHGGFKLWADNNVVYAKVHGAWNDFTALRFSNEFKALAKQDMPEKWAHIVCLDDWELGIPEIEPIIQELVEWCIANGMTCVAQIFSKNMIIKYQIDKMVLERIGNFSKKQFSDKESAICWVIEQGYEVNPELLPSLTG
jgi:hypothetical protein